MLTAPQMGTANMPERRRRRRPHRTIVLLGALLAAMLGGACRGERNVHALARYLPITRPVVATDRVWPPGESTTVLGRGWRARRSEERRTLRIPMRPAELFFRAARAGDLTLELEVKPLGPEPPGAEESGRAGADPAESGPSESVQAGADPAEAVLRVSLNGGSAQSVTLPRRWRIVDVPLRADEIRVGTNVLTLEMKGTGARVRSIRLVSPLGRPAWPARPTRLELSPTTSATDVPGVDAPVDSVWEIALEMPPGARLRADLRATLASGNRRGSLVAAVEVIGDDGAVRANPVASVALDSRNTDGELDVALSAWARRPVVLRLRTDGDANGVVRWERLRIEHDGAALLDPIGEWAGDLAAPPSSGRLGQPDVVLIVLDAARADALSAYGARRPTPALDAIGAEGTVVVGASTPAPWTGPSIPSLLTGLWPDAHGVEIWNRHLPARVATLPALLRDAGYHTALFSHHVIWAGNRTLRRGFDTTLLVSQLDRDRLPQPDELFADERPTLAVLHLLLPHAPYDAPTPFRGRYASEEAAARHDVSPAGLAAFGQRRLIARPSAAFASHARDRYDETVAWADAQVGELVRRLRAAGRYEEALVVVVSDHGEAFAEHGHFMHTRLLYEEVLRVPLLIKWPAGATGFASRLQGPASLVDLLPTMLDGLGIAAPESARFHGRSLLAAAFEGAPLARPRYATTRVSERARQAPQPQIAIVDDGLKMILDMPTGILELYDLDVDPAEARNLALERPVTTAFLVQRALAQRRRNEILLRDLGGGSSSFELEPEALEQLRALGYLQ